MVYFSNKEKNAVTLPHIEHRKHAFLGKIKQMSKSNKLSPREKVALVLLHHRLGHISTRLLISVYTENILKDI